MKIGDRVRNIYGREWPDGTIVNGPVTYRNKTYVMVLWDESIQGDRDTVYINELETV